MSTSRLPTQTEIPLMTPAQIALVRASLAQIAPHAERVGQDFYARLFQTAPQVRTLFPDEIAAQARKLMAMLGMVAAALDQPQRLQAMLCVLGERHAGYGARPAHYDAVGAVLLQTLRGHFGRAFDGDLEEAWAAAYAFMAERMIAASSGASRAA